MINSTCFQSDLLQISISDEKVHKIVNLGKINDFVYDIETETHDFNCGFPLIVHNTDSVLF